MQQSAAYGIFVHLLYGSVQFPEVVREQCTYAVCTQIMPTWEVPSRIVHQVYDYETAHRSSTHRGQQSSVNGIFVHLLYRSVQFTEVGPER